MHGPEESDSVIVAVKPTNKAEQSVAEPVEPRTETKGNADQQSTRRAQDRASVSQALERVRQAARQRKKERFTSLLHHVDPAMLRTAFYAMKRDAAPGVDGMTWETYERDLDRRIETLHERVRLEEEIAERERAEAALRQSQKMDAVGQLTGGVAHDFNNLLTVVTGNLDMLERWTGADGAARHHVEAAQRAAWQGARLAQQLLAFARRQDLRPEIVHLGHAMTEYESLLRRAVGEAIEVTIACDPDLWLCRVDPAQFENSILNLIFNARDAMPAGGRLAISLQNAVLGGSDAPPSAPPGDYVLLSVADSGVGIPPERLDRVFEPFYTTKEVGRGTGLGLSQVYGFVEQSGGHVGIDTAVGAGTTVMIYLPKAEGMALGRETPDPPGEELAKGCETVLLVEDDQGVLEIVTAWMEELGYRVLTAQNGPEALSVLERGEPIDLLFTDLVMPHGISGGELARRARQIRPELKILLGSGYSARISPDAAAASLPILGKPYRQVELAAKLRAVLAGLPKLAAADDRQKD